VDEWVDNGPHMMVGAYHATQKLLADVGASHHVTWQSSLKLPLWDKTRGFFNLQAPSWLPVNLALLWAVYHMPGHGLKSVKEMLKVALSMLNRDKTQTVQEWIDEIGVSEALKRDMLEVLCLGVMNEPLETANAKTFARVLATSFASHSHAKMGWFNKPLSQALIAPIADKLRALGVNMELRHTVRSLDALNHDAVVLAMPAFARNRLLGIKETVDSQAITNIHFWFEQSIAMPDMMVGMLGTYSQWLFDINHMIEADDSGQSLQHVCVTISADESLKNQDECVALVLQEIEALLETKLPVPKKVRFIREKRATVLVREKSRIKLPTHVFDACESPEPGELPATIELAVLSGEKVALDVINITKINA